MSKFPERFDEEEPYVRPKTTFQELYAQKWAAQGCKTPAKRPSKPPRPARRGR